MSPAEQGARVAISFMDAMKSQPLPLALVVMNFLLMAFLFYAGNATQSQRREVTRMVIKWQEATDQLMASCVSKEIMQMVLDAIERKSTEERKQ